MRRSLLIIYLSREISRIQTILAVVAGGFLRAQGRRQRVSSDICSEYPGTPLTCPNFQVAVNAAAMNESSIVINRTCDVEAD